MMIGKKIFIALFALLMMLTLVEAKKILIVPANVDYTNEDLEYVSTTIYDYINTSVIQINSENREEENKIKLVELVLPIAKYNKKIQSFHNKQKNTTFLNRLKTKYSVDSTIWYYFHKDIVTNNSEAPINKCIRVKVCIYDNSISCKKIKLNFDNKLFGITDNSIKHLLDTTKAIINDK